MRKSVSGVARYDVNTVITRVLTDIYYIIDRLEDLPRLSIIDTSRPYKPFTNIGHEFLISLVLIFFLSDFIVVTANDYIVLLTVVRC